MWLVEEEMTLMQSNLHICPVERPTYTQSHKHMWSRMTETMVRLIWLVNVVIVPYSKTSKHICEPVMRQSVKELVHVKKANEEWATQSMDCDWSKSSDSWWDCVPIQIRMTDRLDWIILVHRSKSPSNRVIIRANWQLEPEEFPLSCKVI